MIAVLQFTLYAGAATATPGARPPASVVACSNLSFSPAVAYGVGSFALRSHAAYHRSIVN